MKYSKSLIFLQYLIKIFIIFTCSSFSIVLLPTLLYVVSGEISLKVIFAEFLVAMYAFAPLFIALGSTVSFLVKSKPAIYRIETIFGAIGAQFAIWQLAEFPFISILHIISLTSVAGLLIDYSIWRKTSATEDIKKADSKLKITLPYAILVIFLSGPYLYIASVVLEYSRNYLIISFPLFIFWGFIAWKLIVLPLLQKLKTRLALLNK